MPDPDVNVPKQIGPYRILKKLGAGGMGTVYRAVHSVLQREVALKVLQPTSARNQAVLNRFRAEARASAMPAHENIVNLYESGEADGYHYLALEYVPGRDLLEIIESKGPLPFGFCLLVIRQAARALQHANKHGFVHRDIKPSNFLITRERVVKLTDMGLARKLEDLEDDRMTRDGTTVGTVDYMAPEQARSSRDADTRSDLYALGCTLYHMLTGEPPYPGGTALERLYKHEREPTPNVRAKNDKIPEDVAALVAKMMAKDPEDRFQNPSELLEAIDRLPSARKQPPAGGFSLNDTDQDTLAAPPPKPAPEPHPTLPPAASRPYGVYLAVGLTLCLLVGASLFLLSGSEEPKVAKLVDALPTPPVTADEAKAPGPPGAEKKDVGTPPAIDTSPAPGPEDATKTDNPPTESPPESANPADPKPADPAPAKVAKGTPTAPPPVPSDVVPKAPPKTKLTDELLDDVPDPTAPKPMPEQETKGLKDLFSMPDVAQSVPEEKDKKGGEKPRKKTGVARRIERGPVVPVVVDLPPPLIPKNLEQRAPIELDEKEKETILGPWARNPLPELTRPERTYMIRRVDSKVDGVHYYNGIKPAWNEALANLAGGDTSQPGWLEVETEGPIFDGSHTFSGRPFVMRAAAGFEPTLVFEEHRPERQNYWLEFVDNGRVEIEGIHFLVYADDLAGLSGEFDLIRAEGTDLVLKRCAFTILGRHPGINVVRLASSKKSKDAPPARVRFEDCVARAELASMVTLDAASADILVQGCCLVSRDKQLFRVQTPDVRDTVSAVRALRFVDSTLVSRGDILRARVDGKRPAALAVTTANSAFVWVKGTARRPMVQFDLFDGATDIGRVGWTAIRSVYVGWPALAAQSVGGQGAKTFAKDLAAWRETWATTPDQELFVDDKSAGTLAPEFLFQPYPRFADGPWEFGSSGTRASVGYDPNRCLPFSPYWFETTFGLFEPLAVGIKDPVRDFADLPFTQQVRVNLANDESLADAIRQHADATRLEVTLEGEPNKRYDVSPVSLKGVTLVLRFPNPGAGKGPVFILQPKGEGTALFDIEGGSLEIEFGGFIWPKQGQAPERFARVQRGDLRLNGCWVMTSLVEDESKVSELVRFEADPREKKLEWRRLELNNTMMVSAAPSVALEAPAAAVAVYNCLLVSQDDVFRVQFGEQPPAGWRGFMEILRSTISAAGGAIHLYPYPAQAPLPSRPFLLTVADTLFTAVTDPRLVGAAKRRTGTVLTFEGDSLARGLVAWHGTNNAYDRLLHRLISPDGQEPSSVTGDTAWLEWVQVWGRRHDPFALSKKLDFKQKLKGDRFQPDVFALAEDEPASLAASNGKAVGANITDFGGKVSIAGRLLTPPKFPDGLSKRPLDKASFLGKSETEAANGAETPSTR